MNNPFEFCISFMVLAVAVHSFSLCRSGCVLIAWILSSAMPNDWMNLSAALSHSLLLLYTSVEHIFKCVCACKLLLLVSAWLTEILVCVYRIHAINGRNCVRFGPSGCMCVPTANIRLSLWLAIAQHPESMWNVRAGSKKQQSIIRYYRIQMCVSKPCMQHAALWLAGFRQSSCARTLLMPSAESLADFIVLVVALWNALLSLSLSQ